MPKKTLSTGEQAIKRAFDLTIAAIFAETIPWILVSVFIDLPLALSAPEVKEWQFSLHSLLRDIKCLFLNKNVILFWIFFAS